MKTNRLSLKILSALLALLMLLPLASCGAKSGSDATSPATASATEAVVTSPASTASEATLPATEAATATATEPITEPATEAATAAETEPATTAATEPITEPATAPVTTAAETEPITEPATEPAPQKIVVTLTEFDAEVPVGIHTALQANYLADPDVHSILTYADKGGNDELSRPAPITLSWAVETLDEVAVKSFSVKVSTDPDLSRPKTIVAGKSKNSCEFYNALIGTTYYWNVTANGEDGVAYVSATSSFTTEAQGPRNLYVDSVTNVRDLGGWQTEDGGRIRQGLLYRGARLTENFDVRDVLISDAGIRTLRNELGIKCEIDLRQTKDVNDRDEAGTTKAEGDVVSALGNKVRYVPFPMEYDRTLLFSDEKNLQRIREIFAFLADESNYPIYFHCSIGTDRTGMIAWLLNGLCGVSEEDLWRDYLFSNFGQISAVRTRERNEDVYVNQLKSAEGDTFAEKIYNYLKDTVGVAESDLQAVIGILKEPAAN